MKKFVISDEELRKACIEYETIWLNQIPSNEKIDHVFSDRFNNFMDKLIKMLTELEELKKRKKYQGNRKLMYFALHRKYCRPPINRR